MVRRAQDRPTISRTLFSTKWVVGQFEGCCDGAAGQSLKDPSEPWFRQSICLPPPVECSNWIRRRFSFQRAPAREATFSSETVRGPPGCGSSSFTRPQYKLGPQYQRRETLREDAQFTQFPPLFVFSTRIGLGRPADIPKSICRCSILSRVSGHHMRPRVSYAACEEPS